jgi:hypothetical protein
VSARGPTKQLNRFATAAGTGLGASKTTLKASSASTNEGLAHSKPPWMPDRCAAIP